MKPTPKEFANRLAPSRCKLTHSLPLIRPLAFPSMSHGLIRLKPESLTLSGLPIYVARRPSGSIPAGSILWLVRLQTSASKRMPTNRSMPPGPVIPELPYAEVSAAARWLCNAFGFSERLRIGSHRIQLHVGAGSMVVVEGDTSGSVAGSPRPWCR